MEAQRPASAQTAADRYRPSLDGEMAAVPPSVSRSGGGFTTPSATWHRAGQVTDQVRSGQVVLGRVESGQGSGQVRSGRIQLGRVRSGQVKSLPVRSGQVR